MWRLADFEKTGSIIYTGRFTDPTHWRNYLRDTVFEVGKRQLRLEKINCFVYDGHDEDPVDELQIYRHFPPVRLTSEEIRPLFTNPAVVRAELHVFFANGIDFRESMLGQNGFIMLNGDIVPATSAAALEEINKAYKVDSVPLSTKERVESETGLLGGMSRQPPLDQDK